MTSGTPTTDHAHELCIERHSFASPLSNTPHCAECGDAMVETVPVCGASFTHRDGQIGWCTSYYRHDGEHYDDNYEPRGVQ